MGKFTPMLPQDLIIWEVFGPRKGIIRKALRIGEKIFDKEHLDVGVWWNNLGLGTQGLCKYEEAIDYFKKASAIFIKNFGKNSNHSNKVMKEIVRVSSKMK